LIRHPDADAKRVVCLRFIKSISTGEKAGKSCITLEFTEKLQKTGEKVLASTATFATLTIVAHFLRQEMHLHFSPEELHRSLASLKGAAQRYIKS